MAPLYTEFPFPRSLFEKFVVENKGGWGWVQLASWAWVLAFVCSDCWLHSRG